MVPDYSRRRFLAGCGIAATSALAAGASAGGTDGRASADGQASPPETRWNRTYQSGSNDEVNAVLPAADDGFVAVGATEGDDGTTRVWLFKVGPTGALEWQRTYEEGGLAVGEGLAATDDGYAIAGYTDGGSSDSLSGLVVRVGENGVEQLRETVDHDLNTTDQFEAVEYDGGQLILAGGTSRLDSGWIVGMDEFGRTEFNERHSEGGRNYFYQVITHPQEGYVAVGRTDNSTQDLHGWIFNFDAEGERIWSQAHARETGNQNDPREDFNAFYDIVETTNGFVLAGANARREGNGERRGWVMQVNVSGGDQWETPVPGGAFTQLLAIERHELTYVVAGVSAADATGSDSAGFSAQIGIEGDVLWTGEYTGDGQSVFTDVHRTDAGGLIHFGATGGGSSGWAVKLGGEEIATPTPTPTDSPTPTPTDTEGPPSPPTDTQNPTSTTTPTDDPGGSGPTPTPGGPTPTPDGSGPITSDPDPPETTETGGSGGGLPVEAVGVGVAIVALGAGGFLYNQYRRGDEGAGGGPGSDAPAAGSGAAAARQQGGQRQPPARGQPQGGQGQGQPPGGQGRPQGGQSQPPGGQGHGPRGGQPQGQPPDGQGQPPGGQGHGPGGQGQPHGGRSQPKGGQGQGQPPVDQGQGQGQPPGGQGQPPGGQSQPPGGQGQPPGEQGQPPGERSQPQGGRGQPQGGQGQGQPTGGQGQGRPAGQGPPDGQAPSGSDASAPADQGQSADRAPSVDSDGPDGEATSGDADVTDPSSDGGPADAGDGDRGGDATVDDAGDDATADDAGRDGDEAGND